MQPRRLQLPFGSSCYFAVAVVALAEAKTLTSLWPRSLAAPFPFSSPSLLALLSMPLLTLDIGWAPCRDSGRSLLLDASFTFVRGGKGEQEVVRESARGTGAVVSRCTRPSWHGKSALPIAEIIALNLCY